MAANSSFLKVVLFVSLLSSFLTFDCKAQKILVFDREGHNRIRFHVHDEISVHTTDGNFWDRSEITAIGDSSITIVEDEIALSTIDAIKYNNRHSGIQLLQRVTEALPIAGLTYIGVTTINSLINHYSPVLPENTLIISGAFLASGPIVYFLTNHKHKINKHHRLKIIDVSIN